MDARDYLRLARRNWLILASFPIIGLTLALTYSLLQQPQYESTSKVFVSTQQAATAVDLSQGSTYAQAVVQSYADVVRTPIILGPVIDQLSLGTTPGALADQVAASAPANTVVLSVSVTDSSAVRAADISNAISRQLTSVVRELSPSSSSESSPVKVTIVQSATVPSTAISPKTSTNSIFGALLGLIVGLVISILRERLDNRVRTEQDLSAISNAPVVGSIAFDSAAKEQPLIVQVDPRSPRAESFRALRTSLQFLSFDEPTRVIVITSSIEGEGKSTTAVNLAIAMADAGVRVALVDGDLRRPKVAAYLGLEGQIGLTDVLIGRVDLDTALQTWGEQGLLVLAGGALPPNPSELLQSRRMVEVLDNLKSRCETVIIDAPPLLPVTDGAILSKLSSGAVVVAAMSRVRRPQLAHALHLLHQIDSRVLGILATMVPSRGPDAYAYGSYKYEGAPASEGAAR